MRDDGAVQLAQAGKFPGEAAAVIDLPALGGSGRLQAAGVPGFALLKY